MYDVREKRVVARAAATAEVSVPYVPGFLAFRELPLLAAALELLPAKPDVVLVDGHGYAHPRRAGIATHLGVALDVPTVGVAKKKLVGREVEAGGRILLVDGGEVVGEVLLCGRRKLYVSAGHRVTLDDAVKLVKKLLEGEHVDVMSEADAFSKAVSRLGLRRG